MTGVDLILAALAAGAAAGAKDTVSAAVQDAYTALRDALTRRLRGGDEEQAPRALETREDEPGAWEALSAEQLTESGADHDREVLEAARQLVELTRAPETRGGAPKFQVDLRNAKAVMVGDHNTQTVNLG
ncbi:hypothetical protein ACWEQ2_31415 [Streptomyces sp. NPDC004096]